MTPVTYGDLIARAARAVHDGAAQVQHRPFDTTTEALSAMADFHGVLDAVEGHTWAIINPARAAGITSSHWPEPAEIAALGMAAQIRRVTGTLRPHPSLLRPAVGPWGEAARCLRAASDLLAVHRNLDGTPRSPDAGAIEDRAGRAGALARVGDLADAVVAMEDFLALRAGQAGVSWPEVRRWLPGMAAIRAHARDAAINGQPGHVGPLDAVGLIGTPIRTDDVLDELGDRLLRLRQSAWQQVSSPDRSIATLRDIATAGVAVHAHTATFHGADLTSGGGGSSPAGVRALVDRGRSWQRLHAELRAFASPGRPDDVVHQDLIAIGRCLRTVAPLPGQAKTTPDPTSTGRRRSVATLNGAVTVMADIADSNARTFARIARTGQLHINARALTGAEITDDPDLVRAKVDGRLVPAPQPHAAAITDLYDVVRHHPIRAPEATSSPRRGATRATGADRDPIARPEIGA
jgi:hypothetical protein